MEVALLFATGVMDSTSSSRVCRRTSWRTKRAARCSTPPSRACTRPSSPNQPALNECFSDVIALLSVFSYCAVAGRCSLPGNPAHSLLPLSALTPDRLRTTSLLGLADQMGQERTQLRLITMLIRALDISGRCK